MNLTAIKEFFYQLCLLYDIDMSLLKNKQGFSGTMSRYNIESDLFKISFFIDYEKYDKALILMNEFIKDKNINVKYENLNEKQFEKISNTFQLFTNIKKTYNNYIETDYKILLSDISKNSIFNKNEITVESYPPTEYINAESNNIFENFKSYCFTGTDKLDFSNSYTFSNTVLITDDISIYLDNHKKNYNKPHFSLVFVIDEPIEYSYFVILCSYKNSVYIVTDLILHENPKTKISSRNPIRKVENKLNSTSLPYRIIFEMDDMRKDNTNINPKDFKFEIFYKNIKEYFNTQEKIFLLEFFDYLKTNLILNAPVNKLFTKNTVDTKLLKGSNIILNTDDDDFTGWNESNRRRWEEIQSGLKNAADSKSIIKVSGNLVLSKLDNNYLITSDQYHKISKWAAFEEIKKDFNDNYINKLNIDTAHLWLKKQLDSKYTELLNKLATHKKILFLFDEEIEQFTKSDISKTDLIYNSVSDNIWFQFNIGYSKSNICMYCNKRKISYTVSIIIHHYNQLVWLLNLKDRFDLPAEYRSYKSGMYIPYHGNSILDNVSPLSLISDPMSVRYPGGIKIGFNICKHDWNQIVKENFISDEISFGL